MKLTVKYEYQEEYIPPRCRNPRCRQIEKTMSVNIREITSEEAPVAMIVTDYETRDGQFGVCDIPYRWYKNKLFKVYRHQGGSSTGNLYTLDDVAYNINQNGYGYPYDADEKRRKSDIRKTAKRYLIIDGEIYREAGEPRYCIYTFGLGHNHGGSSFSIDEHYNSNISKERYFNALQREEAIIFFNETASGRGDTNSVNENPVDNIKILIPEAVKCNPQKQHGNGCGFTSSLESMISGSKNKAESGLMVMAVGMAELSKIG
jgi:hypothetical protein